MGLLILQINRNVEFYKMKKGKLFPTSRFISSGPENFRETRRDEKTKKMS